MNDSLFIIPGLFLVLFSEICVILPIFFTVDHFIDIFKLKKKAKMNGLKKLEFALSVEEVHTVQLALSRYGSSECIYIFDYLSLELEENGYPPFKYTLTSSSRSSSEERDDSSELLEGK